MGYVYNPPPVGGGEGWLDVPGDIVFDGMGHEIISFQENVPFFTTGRDNVRDLYMDGRPYEEY